MIFENMTGTNLRFETREGGRIELPRGEHRARVARQVAPAAARGAIECVVMSPGLVLIGSDDEGNPIDLPEPVAERTILVLPEVYDHASTRDRSDLALPYDFKGHEDSASGPVAVFGRLLVRK